MERSHLQGNGLLQQSRSTKRHFWSLLDGATLDGTMYWPIIKDLVSRHLGAIRFRTLNCTERKLDDFMNLIFPASGRKMPLYRQQQQVQPAQIEVRDMVAFCCSPAGCDRMFEDFLLLDDLGDAIPVVCNNEGCRQGSWMHGDCFAS